MKNYKRGAILYGCSVFTVFLNNTKAKCSYFKCFNSNRYQALYLLKKSMIVLKKVSYDLENVRGCGMVCLCVVFVDVIVCLLVFKRLINLKKYDYLYFLSNLIVIYSFVETNRTYIKTPRLLIGRSFNPTKKKSQTALNKHDDDSHSHGKRLSFFLDSVSFI